MWSLPCVFLRNHFIIDINILWGEMFHGNVLRIGGGIYSVRSTYSCKYGVCNKSLNIIDGSHLWSANIAKYKLCTVEVLIRHKLKLFGESYFYV